ncbi:MAG TPA: SWIM zinc finger family protein [Peptococcaceae bacterium]|nr:SWIM zinc finger family protein [Peptococcaceae bacterium]
MVGRGHGVFCSCEDWRQRGIVCKHIAAVALHELGARAHARSTRSMVGLLLQL